MSKNVFVIGVVCILLGTTMVPVVDTVNIYTDSIPKTENIIQISGDGNTLYVGGSGPNNYTRIQDAIDNASDGDTVFVYDGTYYENLVIDKSINLMGQDRYIAIIDGRKYKDVIYICADGIIMSNFTIVNSGESDPWDAGIEGNASQIIIRDCNFYSNCYGIKILKNENKIINNIFRHNRYAIGCSSSNNLFQGNEIYRNNDGIDVASDNNTIIQNNIQQGSSGIYIDGWYNKVNGNVISQNMEGILISGSYNEISNNDISLNTLGLRLFLCSSKNNIIKNNNFRNNEIDATVEWFLVFGPFRYQSFLNIFYRSYWDNWHMLLPKPILGEIIIAPFPEFPLIIPWITFDVCPRLFLYEWLLNE